MLYTHEHADHTNGIDDLRIFSVRQREALPIYGPPETLDRLRTGFPYIFDDACRSTRAPRSPNLSCTRSSPTARPGSPGVDVLPLAFQHGHIRVYGYRIGPLAYITDVKAIPEAERRQPARARRAGAQRALVASAPDPPEHPRGDQAAQALGARRTYLTHLTHETGHAELAAQLPAGIVPAL